MTRPQDVATPEEGEASIREGRAADAPAQLLVEVNDLHAAALPGVFRAVGTTEETIAFLRDWTRQDNTHLLVAEGAGGPLGFALVGLSMAPAVPIFVSRRCAEVHLLVVAEAARGRGLGRTLMEHAQTWADEQGAADVRVVVWEFNERAIRFYERLGYATVRRMMWRDLGPTP